MDHQVALSVFSRFIFVSLVFLQLEGKVEELLKELKESRDKLIHQEQTAKAALQQMQRETAYRIEQVRLGCGFYETVKTWVLPAFDPYFVFLVGSTLCMMALWL